MSHRELLDELRYLLHQEPSRGLWTSVCHTLSRCPADTLELALNYARDLTAHWPDAYTEAPASWWQLQDERQAPLPYWPLTRSLVVEENAERRHLRVLRMREVSQHIGRLALKFSRNPAPSLDEELASTLRLLPCRLSLKHLVLDGAPLPHHLDYFLIPWPELESLSLRESSLRGHHLQTLLRKSTFPKLRHLDLRGNPRLFSSGFRQAPHAQELLRDLDSLDLRGIPLDTPGFRNFVQGTDFSRLGRFQYDNEGSSPDFLAVLQAHHLPLPHLPPHEVVNRGLGYPEMEALLERLPKGAKTLDLSGNRLDDRIFAGLQKHGLLSGLEVLDLSRNRIEGNAIQITGSLPALRTLCMDQNPLRDEGLRDLLSRVDFPRLETLSLRRNPLGPGGAALLSERGALPGLQDLDLRDTRIGDVGISALGRSHRGHMERLRIPVANYRPETWSVMAEAPAIALNTDLNKRHTDPLPWFRGKGLGDGVIISLLSASYTGLLRHVDLSRNRLTSRSMHILARLEHLAPSTLNLSYNPLKNEGIKALSRALCLPEVRELDLSYTGMDSEGLAELLQAPLPRLEVLNVSGNPLDEEALEWLAASSLPELHTLRLKECFISARSVEKLLDTGALPSLRSVTSLQDWNETQENEDRGDLRGPLRTKRRKKGRTKHAEEPEEDLLAQQKASLEKQKAKIALRQAKKQEARRLQEKKNKARSKERRRGSKKDRGL